jgi:hypothetical protein
VRIDDVAVDWIPQVSGKRGPKQQDSVVKIFECLGGPWINGVRETRVDTASGIPSEVSGSEAKVKGFYPRYQRSPFYIKGKGVGLLCWMNETDVFAMCPLTLMRGHEVLVEGAEISATSGQMKKSYSFVKLIALNRKQLRNVLVINTMRPSVT